MTTTATPPAAAVAAVQGVLLTVVMNQLLDLGAGATLRLLALSLLAGVTFERCSGLRVTAPGASLVVAPCTALHGTVRIGPTTPVCKEGVPCSKPAAHLLLSFNRGREQVQARTDTLGRYRVRLVPGTWTLTTRVGIRPAPLRFVVPRAPSATRDFSIDTGIR